MKHALLILSMAAIVAAASAQTSSSSTPAASTALSTKPGTAAPKDLTPWVKLPPGVPKVAHGPVKVPCALRYEDIKIGTGPEGKFGQLWHFKYTAWRAADGVMFNSWEEHRKPIMGKDGKPELGPDGKPMMGDPDPVVMPVGEGRMIPGFDFGLEGMRVGGKRRIFIPWQMAYGTKVMPDRAGHPGLPAKSDLIFDVELVDVKDFPQHMGPPQQAPGAQPHPGANAQPGAAPTATAPATPATPASSSPPAPKPATPAQPSAPPQTQPQ